MPIAALLIGALLTLGVAVLLVVVLAIRKKRDQTHHNSGEGKEKQIGMKTEQNIYDIYN